MTSKLTPERAREVLSYEPVSGVLAWKWRPNCYREIWNIRFAGKRAGGPGRGGYRQIGIDGRTLDEHYVIWLIMKGEPPLGEIDHWNTDKADNCWINLRDASHGQNAYNRGAQKNNKTGLKGVFKAWWGERWLAKIRANGRNIHLGCFKSPEAAHAAYCEAAALHHGEFANHGVSP